MKKNIKSFTVKKEEYNIFFKILDKLAGVLEFIGIPLGKLESESLIKAAVRSTGLDDFGEDNFRETLDQTVIHSRNATLTKENGNN